MHTDLSAMDPAASVPIAVGRAFNALLETAKSEKGDHPMVAAIEALDLRGNSAIPAMNAGGLRTLVGQVRSAYEG